MIPTYLVVLSIVLVLFSTGVNGAGCPHCHGNFASCTFSSSGKCITVEAVAKNAGVLAGSAAGVLSLAGLIKPRFLRMMSNVAFETVVALVKRAEPGSAFEVKESTGATEILNALANGLITLDIVLMKLCGMIEDTTDEAVRAKLERRLQCIKTAADIKAKMSSSSQFTSLMDSGILTFMWAKVSAFVMNRDMQIKLSVGSVATDSSTDLSAKLVRPKEMWEFAEMMNLFLLFTHALGISSVLVLTDFFEHVVYDSIRLRGATWTLAHELMVILFRRIEDSGGKVSLSKAYEEMHLNSIMDEARLQEAVFFRSPGGNPGQVTGKDAKNFNGKFSPTGKLCYAFNTGVAHAAKDLLPDGTCKYNHACDHWVKGKGKNGRCLCEKGTPGHNRAKCDHPNKCDEPVA